MEENSGCAWKVALVGRRTTTMQCGLTRTRRIVLMRFPRRAAIGSKCDWAASPSVRTPPSTLLRPSSCRGYHCQTIALNDRPSIQTLSCLGLRSCRPHQNAAGGRRVVQRRPSSRCSTGGELGVPRDRLLELAGSRFGRTLLRYVGLPCPPALHRVSVHEPFAKAASEVTATLVTNASSPAASGIAAAVRACGTTLQIVDGVDAAAERGDGDGVVIDTTWIRSSRDLTWLFSAVSRHIGGVGAGAGRIAAGSGVVLLSRDPESCPDAEAAAAARAVQGFTRSLAKEIGGRGCRANLLIVADDVLSGDSAIAQAALATPLYFFLSPHSAYVSAQPLHVARKGLVSAFVPQDPLASLAGKNALVTGGSRGIGRAISERLAGDGANVTVLDLDGPATDATAAAIGGSSLVGDVTTEECISTVTRAAGEVGGFDIVVHNAGITRDRSLRRMTEKDFNSVISVNTIAVQNLTEALLQGDLLREDPRIVALSSINGIAGAFGQLNYSASKAALIGYVSTMAADSRLTHLRGTINAIAPGYIETQMTAAIPAMARTVGRRLSAFSQGGWPSDVAGVASFLSSPGSQAISGETLRVCGSNIVGA